MNTANAAGERSEKARAPIELDRRYGRIGISAVAAAVRYQSETKNPVYAPAGSSEDS
jgi:hypothetical protein